MFFLLLFVVILLRAFLREAKRLLIPQLFLLVLYPQLIFGPPHVLVHASRSRVIALLLCDVLGIEQVQSFVHYL